MTVSEPMANCEGDSFTSHRGQHGNSSRIEEDKMTKDSIPVDELSEEIANISLEESRRDSALGNELEEKLEGLSISSVVAPELDKANDAVSVDKVEESDAKEREYPQFKLNITETVEENELNETEVKEEQKSTKKNRLLVLNIIVNDEADTKSGDRKYQDGDEDEDEDARKGVLSLRSPMRPEYSSNARKVPYQGPPRSSLHNSGGYCFAEPVSYNTSDQNWPNIPCNFETTYTSSQPDFDFGYPLFSVPTVLAEEPDEGIFDVSSPEGVSSSNESEILDGLSPETISEILDRLDEVQAFEKLAPVSGSGILTQADHISSSIPLSVAEYEYLRVDTPPPSVDSSGYYGSLYSPRSTNSTPSPSSSLKGSQEKINMGYSDPAYRNIGSVSPIQASPAYTDCTDSSYMQPGSHMLHFSPAYSDLPSEDSRSSSVHFYMPETSVASKPKPLAPKPTFSKRPGKIRLNEKMDKSKKSATWAAVSSTSDACLVTADADGDTQLMILLMSVPVVNDCKLEMIYALVERLCKIPDSLTAVNGQGQSALYMTALHYPTMHKELITRYLADAMLSVGANLDTCYEGGNTLLHYLCRQGAVGNKSLTELLTLNKMQSCFNLDKFNDQGMTPLHVAVTSHKGKQLDCSTTVRLLIEAGANATLPTKNEQSCSALHLAINGSCDPIMITALFSSASLAAMCEQEPGYGQDTILHLVARRNDLPFSQQSSVFKKLVDQKAYKYRRGSKGKFPLDLVAADRKERIKQIIQQKF